MALSEELQTMYNKLTDKQQRFVDLWTGEAAETAKLVGYSTPDVAGKRCLKNVPICTLIKAKRDEELKPLIATRKERQEFWSKVMTGKLTSTAVTKDGSEVEVTPKLKDRLKASELLGKSEGDFIDRLHVGGMDGGDLHITVNRKDVVDG